MSTQLNLDIEVAAAKDFIAKEVPVKPNKKAKVDISQLEHEIEQKRKGVMQTREENALKDNEVRANAIQVKRLKSKAVVFEKYQQLIEKQLEVLRMDMQNQNQFYYLDYHFFTLHQTSYPSTIEMLVTFENNLKNQRKSSCNYKYCCPASWQTCCVCWITCWCMFPIYCCYRGCLSQSLSQTKLRQVYEKYELMMVQENSVFALPAK